MRNRIVLIAMSIALGACASADDKEWMKVDQKYTAAEFRRDYAACSKGASVNEECMRGKGWVAVSPGTAPPKVVAPAQPGPPQGITNR